MASTYAYLVPIRRAPLLLVAGSLDHIVRASMNRRNFRKYADRGPTTDFHEFPGRTHWIIAQEGWEEVAGYIAVWLAGLPRREASPG